MSPGRADRAAGAVDEVGAEDRVEDLDAAAPRVHRAAVVVGEVAGEDRAEIVARRWEKIAAARLLGEVLRTFESTTMISPRVVTAAPGPSLPPRVSVMFSITTKPVPSWRRSRFSKHVCRSV